MKRIARLSTLLGLLAALCAGSLAGASSAAVSAPTGLHGFLLVGSEPQTSTFHRTPSFAWKPVAGALRYELQLSTSNAFRDNGILYDGARLATPVAAPTLTLPWITGSPHSLYARVRAFLSGGQVTPWSASYGFDVTSPAAPAALSGADGLLRWTTVPGADAYEVWLLDKDKQPIEVVRTNVLDERDLYAGSVPPSVRWRVRALRMDVFGRANGLPAATYGPWSPVYHSTNGPLQYGPITLTGTISDFFSTGSAHSAPHQLMPGFTWSGVETLDGTVADYYRVYVFTDAQCLNPVYVGEAVPSPAYAPRVNGLALPKDDANYLLDPGVLTQDSAADGDVVVPNEELAPASPTVGNSASGKDMVAAAVIGPPTSLWDVNWPKSGYYWTVVGVQQIGDGEFADLELPQDVCAAGRVQRLGISSQPTTTGRHGAFATGLSSTGRLVTAAHTSRFYGEPLIAWTAASGSSNYEVQWSRRVYPFTSRGTRYTFTTSAILPLKPGTWYYRVRGFDYNLPTGAQAMAWSQPTKIVITAPTFHVLGAARR